MKLWQFDNLTNFKLFLITNILRHRLILTENAFSQKLFVHALFLLVGFRIMIFTYIHFVNEKLISEFQISKIMFITENSGFGSFNITTENQMF